MGQARVYVLDFEEGSAGATYPNRGPLAVPGAPGASISTVGSGSPYRNDPTYSSIAFAGSLGLQLYGPLAADSGFQANGAGLDGTDITFKWDVPPPGDSDGPQATVSMGFGAFGSWGFTTWYLGGDPGTLHLNWFYWDGDFETYHSGDMTAAVDPSRWLRASLTPDGTFAVGYAGGAALLGGQIGLPPTVDAGGCIISAETFGLSTKLWIDSVGFWHAFPEIKLTGVNAAFAG